MLAGENNTDEMKLTKRNHSNPCFWTAIWNRNYLDNIASEQPKELRARKQPIYSLNVRADKIIKTTVEDVHVDKGIGIVEVTPAAMKQFYRKYSPGEYNSFINYMEGHPETLLLPLEQLLDGWEKTPAYKTLLSVVAKESIDTWDDISYLAAFVMLQHTRSHAVLRSALERINATGMEAFEYFWLLKHIMSNTKSLFSFIWPLAKSQWLLYRTTDHTFPLPDTPVLIRPMSVMIALSPRLLAEIRLDMYMPNGSCTVKSGIPKRKLNEYRQRAIGSTFKELIFSDRNVLEEWQASKYFRRQVNLVRSERSYSVLLEHALQRSLYPNPVSSGAISGQPVAQADRKG